MANRLEELAQNAQNWANEAAERASELTREASARAIELAQSAADQAAEHLQDWAESGADHHHNQADERGKLSEAARRRAIPHMVSGLFGHEPSAQKARELHGAADEHDAAMLGHRLAAIALDVAGAGLRYWRGQKAEAPRLPEADIEDEDQA